MISPSNRKSNKKNSKPSFLSSIKVEAGSVSQGGTPTKNENSEIIKKILDESLSETVYLFIINTIELATNHKTMKKRTIQNLEDNKSQSLLTQPERAEESVATIPAVKKTI